MGMKLLDLEGVTTGTPVTKKLLVSVVLSTVLFFVCQALPLEKYGESTSTALGFLVFIITLMILAPVPIAIPSFLIVLGGVYFGFWDFAAVMTTFGKSSFLPIMGMTIVALGCEFTPFGKRLAFIALRRFSNNPVKLVLVISIVAAILSAFCSNVAVIIMFSGTCAGMLHAMGEKPGESKLGKTLMLVITMASCVGGMALISGSPTGNTNAIKFMSAASGELYTVGYFQWAVLGSLCMAVCIVPFTLIYIKATGLKKTDMMPVTAEYLENASKELGHLSGAEIRWIIIVAGMVITMLSGMNTAQAALLFALISMLPVIGTVPAAEAFKRLPIQMMVAMGFVNLMSGLFSNTGLGDLMGALIRPLMQDMGPLPFSIACALITGLLINVFVNAQTAAYALTLSMFTPACINLGYNPSIVLLPTMFISSYFFCMGPNAICLLNRGYGYWKMQEPMLPGFIVVVLGSIIFPVICFFVGPLIGMAIYL